MNPLLFVQLIAWSVACAGAAAALSQYFAFRKKEKRLPEACEFEDLDARVTRAKKALTQLEDRAEKSREKIGEAVQKIAELEELQRWQREQKAELEQIAAERRTQEILRADNTEQEKVRKDLASEVGRLSADRATLGAEVSNLSTRQAHALSELEDMRDQRQLLQAELASLSRDRQEQELLRASNMQMEQEREALVEEVGRLRADQATASANLTHLSTQKADAKAELEESHRRLEETTRLHQDKILQLNLTQNDLNLKGVDLERLNENIELVTNSLQKARERFEQEQTKIEDARRKLVQVQTDRHALEQECLRLKSEIDSLNKWKETLTALLQKLQANVDRLDTKDGKESRYRDLWSPSVFPALALNRRPATEAAVLTNTERYLKGHGLHYPKRVLHAFHTALKTADMSPLVVLAGISGTGKSLLPKRYAEAVGMHFVSLAVQPRWDSPQDLFGFFNHLEGRFKATDLARAMVQFEQYNRKNWMMPKDWAHGCEDRMLLVLLDEMNLARVEYYFSEFLSKLETRRDVDEANPSDRAKAEIPLEMGSLREDEKPIRLYPGKNILFAGTMNEDESTQSLSDKVVDRACVLRFGRPQSLDRTGLSTNGPGRAEMEGVGFDTWRAWCSNSLSGGDERRMNEWIAKLNDGMDGLGKPFAHRVHQAILSYAANYPSVAGHDSIKLALADQIEQRILPKLRGVEIEGNDDAFERIEKVILEAEDEELVKAFRRGRESRAGTFLWRGLDRSEQ